MNDCIKKLATQADIWCDQNYPNSEFYGIRWEEKFAELIVRECEVALSPMLRDMISRGQAYDLIKQHFGVKE